MSLAQALATAPKPKPGPKCAVFRARQQMDGDDLAAFDTALDDVETYGHLRLYRILRAEGYDIGRDAISRHRAGECACGPR